MFKRKPDFVIGDNYLLRWYLIPRNKWFNIYLHNISRSDDDRALHDHPWWNVSILLKGRYIEVVPDGEHIRERWSVIFRSARDLHRLKVIDNECAWSLFITGPKVREWGFACPKGWVHWLDFVNLEDTGKPGAGCGEFE